VSCMKYHSMRHAGGLGRVRLGGGMAAIEIHGWPTGELVGMSGTR
jgi:hypothetical protein